MRRKTRCSRRSRESKLSKSENQRLLAEKKSLEDERERLGKALNERAAQINSHSEEFAKRHAEFEDVINRTKGERDKEVRMVAELTKTVENMEALVRERGAFQTALEEELKREKETRLKVQAHSKFLEETLLAMEKKINSLL